MKTISVNLGLDYVFIIPGSIKPEWDTKLKARVGLIKNNYKDCNVHLILHLNKEHYDWVKLDEYFIPVINKIMDECNIAEFHYVFHLIESNYVFNSSNNILCVDYYAMQTYRLVIEKEHPYNEQWNSNGNKGLFLIGKPNKMNRLPILYHMYKNSLLNKFEWSFHLNDDIVHTIKKLGILAPYATDSEISTFLKDCNRVSPDNAVVDFRGSNDDATVHYSGFPFDPNMYKNTLFSLIAETDFNDYSNPYITEKTWRVIVNKHPFIMASTVNSLAYLKSLGFRTFEQYLPVKNYDSIVNNDDRLNSIHANLFGFFDNDNIEQINIDVEYNFEHFKKFALGEFAKLESIYKSNPIELSRFLIDMAGYR
jgi:hypothetical protein